MKTFSYSARTANGEKVKGTVAAESAPAAVRAAAAEGKIVIRITEQRPVRLPRPAGLFGSISAEDRIAFFRELAALLSAGIPIHTALAHLLDSTKADTGYGQLAADLHRAVTHGTSLSHAMEMHAHVFAPSLIGMVRAGEESGTLDTVLREAADFLTEEHALRESLRSALAYPLFLLAATVLSLVLMTMFILPVFAVLLRELQADLPLPTRMLLGLSDIVSAQPYLIPAAIGGLALITAALLRMPAVRLRLDGMLLRIPVIGSFASFAAWQMILRTLAVLMRSGIRLDRAVALAQFVTGNRVLSHRLERMEQSLIHGRSFAQSIANEPYLPPLLRGMLAAGEEAGNLEDLLQQGADYCGRRASQISARIQALAEPVMVVFVAGLIFFAVLSFLLPIFDAMDAMM